MPATWIPDNQQIAELCDLLDVRQSCDDIGSQLDVHPRTVQRYVNSDRAPRCVREAWDGYLEWLKTARHARRVNGSVKRQLEQMKAMLDFIASHPGVTVKQIADHMHRTPRWVYRQMERFPELKVHIGMSQQLAEDLKLAKSSPEVRASMAMRVGDPPIRCQCGAYFYPDQPDDVQCDRCDTVDAEEV